MAQTQSQFTETSRVILKQDLAECNLGSGSELNSPQKLQRLAVFTWKSEAYLKTLRLELSDLSSLAPLWQDTCSFSGSSERALTNEPSPLNDSYHGFQRVTEIISHPGHSSETSTGHIQWWIKGFLDIDRG